MTWKSEEVVLSILTNIFNLLWNKSFFLEKEIEAGGYNKTNLKKATQKNIENKPSSRRRFCFEYFFFSNFS
jgi:hypothetical protein